MCGKLVVATSDQEVVRMDALYERSKQNTIEVHRLSAAELVEREPNIVGMGALYVPSTGIVSYLDVCRKMGARIVDGVERYVSRPVSPAFARRPIAWKSTVTAQAGGPTN